MKGNIYHSGDISKQNPAWYWDKGLHDAQIVAVDCLQLPRDYKSKNTIWNSLKLVLNTRYALYNKTIRSIMLYNYEILTPDSKLKDCYWLEDVLDFCNGKYILNITLTDCNCEHIFTVNFDYAEVE